jgi:4-amino-4-deoxychorismate lyase
MCLLFESIRLLDGKFQNLEYHSFRLNQSRKTLFNASDKIELSKQIDVPNHNKHGIYKCKVTYGLKIESVTFELYVVRSIQNLMLVEDNTITYNHKFTDRSHLSALFAKRGNYDDILIIKNDFVTDSSFSNIIFFDGTKWVTPSTPLLSGTMRNNLVQNKIITEKDIKITELKHFQKARLINAMLPFHSAIDIPMHTISF